MSVRLHIGWLVVLPCAWSTAFAQVHRYDCLMDQRNDLEGTYTELVQACTGSLWLATDQGIWEYDGEELDRQSMTDIPGTTEVSAIAEGRDGRLWLGFRTGQIVYGTPPGNWQAWEIEEGLPQARVTRITEDQQGDRWIATYGEGIYCYQKGRMYQFGEDDGLPSSDVYDLSVSKDGQVWAATDAGVCLLGWRDGKKWLRTLTTEDGLPDNIVTALYLDAAGGCWLGTYEGGIAYCRYQNNEFSVTVPAAWPGGRVTGLTQVGQNQLWVGTAEQGLRVYDLSADRPQPMKTPLHAPPLRIQEVLFDQEGLLWLLSHDQGLCRVQPRIASLEQLPTAPQALAVDQGDTLWVGSRHGLFYHENSSGELRAFTSDTPLNIISMHVDERNRLWLGTFGEGVYVLDEERRQLRAYGAAQGLGNGSVLAITGDENNIWLATLGGVYRTAAANDRPRFVQPASTRAIGTEFLYTNFIDQAGTVWFGTDGRGLSALAEDGTLSTHQRAADGTEIRSVYAIAQDGRGRIWISADDQHLFYYENGSFRPVTLPFSFGRNEIVSLSTDPAGNILIAHQKGVAVYDISAATTVDYNLGDEADFTPVLNAVASDRSGRIWLAGVARLVAYTPFDSTYRSRPSLHLEQVSVYLEPFDFRHEQRLNAAQNNLIFKYQGVWLSEPEAVRYRYQLKGFDPDWIATRDRQAVYSNLPPGAYEFVVTAAPNDRFAAEEVSASYRFEIQPPVYQQIWFVALVVLSLFLFGRYLLRRRETRLQKEATLLKDKVESQYETLKSQINPHFLFNSFNTLVTLIEEHPDCAVTYVEKLADFYRSILQYREQDAVDLKTELQVVKDYHFLLTQRYQDNLKLEVGALPLDARVPPLAVQMLLENAVKHNVISKQHPLQIRIFARAAYLVVENAIQPKFTSEPSTGFGLQNIRSRYALLTQQPVLVEGDDRTFRIALPLIH